MKARSGSGASLPSWPFSCPVATCAALSGSCGPPRSRSCVQRSGSSGTRNRPAFVAAAGPSHMAGAARCAPPLTEQTRIGEEMNCAQLGAASSAARLPRVAKVAAIVAACGSTSCDAAVASTVCANDAGMRPWPAACAQNIVRSCYRWRPNGKRKSARSAALPVYAWRADVRPQSRAARDARRVATHPRNGSETAN